MQLIIVVVFHPEIHDLKIENCRSESEVLLSWRDFSRLESDIKEQIGTIASQVKDSI